MLSKVQDTSSETGSDDSIAPTPLVICIPGKPQSQGAGIVKPKQKRKRKKPVDVLQASEGDQVSFVLS